MSVQYTHPREFSTDTEPKFQVRGSRVSYQFDSIVGRIGREFIFVDEIFEARNSDRAGAIGTNMTVLHEDEVERREKRYRSYEDSPLAHIYDQQETKQSWESWIDSQFRRDGYDMMVDFSYVSQLGQPVRNKTVEAGIMNRDEIGLVECIGGGRMFNDVTRTFDDVYDEELLRLATEVEENGLDSIYD